MYPVIESVQGEACTGLTAQGPGCVGSAPARVCLACAMVCAAPLYVPLTVALVAVVLCLCPPGTTPSVNQLEGRINVRFRRLEPEEDRSLATCNIGGWAGQQASPGVDWHRLVHHGSDKAPRGMWYLYAWPYMLGSLSWVVWGEAVYEGPFVGGLSLMYQSCCPCHSRPGEWQCYVGMHNAAFGCVDMK